MSKVAPNQVHRSGSVRWSLSTLSLVPQPTVLLMGVLICDTLYWTGAGQAWMLVMAECLLGGCLVLWVVATAINVRIFAEPGLHRISWACWAYIGAQAFACALSVTNLVLRLERGDGSLIIPGGIALSVGALALARLALRLERTIEAALRGESAKDWEEDWESA